MLVGGIRNSICSTSGPTANFREMFQLRTWNLEVQLRSSTFDVRTSNFEVGVWTSMFDLLGQTSKFEVGVNQRGCCSHFAQAHANYLLRAIPPHGPVPCFVPVPGRPIGEFAFHPHHCQFDSQPFRLLLLRRLWLSSLHCAYLPVWPTV